VLILGAAHGLAIDGHRFEGDRWFELRLNPSPQGRLEGANIQTCQDAM
jgi:hypothetical protein